MILPLRTVRLSRLAAAPAFRWRLVVRKGLNRRSKFLNRKTWQHLALDVAIRPPRLPLFTRVTAQPPAFCCCVVFLSVVSSQHFLCFPPSVSRRLQVVLLDSHLRLNLPAAWTAILLPASAPASEAGHLACPRAPRSPHS